MKYICFLLLLLFFLGSCKKNFEDINITDYPDPPKVLVNASLVGIVTDENGTEITDYEVHFNNTVSHWSESQYFKLDGQLIHQHGEPLTIITADGHKASFSVKTIKDDVNYLHFAIIKEKHIVTNDLSKNITLNAQDDYKIELEKNSFKQNGKEYNGLVTTESYLIDPEHVIQRQTLPGSSQGLNLQKELTAVDIIHAFYLNIKSETGSPLTSSLSIQPEQPVSEGNEKSVWWFDEENGYWEMLESTFISGKGWQANYAKPGFYCISAEKSGVLISGKVNLGTLPVPGCSVDIQTEDGQKITLQTSNAGVWNALVPKNQELTLHVYNECASFANKNLGSFNSDAFVDVTEISDFSDLFSILKATVKDCDGRLKNNNFLYFEGNGLNNKLFNPSSQIEIVIPVCQNDFLNISFSNISGTESCAKIPWEVKPVIDVNAMFACERAKGQYFNLIIESENKLYWKSATSIDLGRLKIQLMDSGNTGFDFGLWIPAFSVTELQDDMINILFNDALFGTGGFSLYCPTSTLGCGFEKLVITHYPESGDEWIRGYFEGTFWIGRLSPPEANNRKMRGEFQVRKTF